MDNAFTLLTIAFSAFLIQNIVLTQFLGLCSFFGVGNKEDSAIGMGLAVTFVITLSSIITYALYIFVLEPFNLQFLSTISFILIVSGLVQFVEMVIKKFSPNLYDNLGVYLPLITTNCAVLGVALINIKDGYNLIETVANSLGASLGFGLAIILFAGIRERLEYSDIPKAFKGFPIALIAAGLMSIAFLGFNGLIS